MFSYSVFPPTKVSSPNKAKKKKNKKEIKKDDKRTCGFEFPLGGIGIEELKDISCKIFYTPQLLMGDREEVIFKVLVLGEINAGKTSLIRRYVERKFTRNYKPTMGADFNQKDFFENDKMSVRMQLWDIAGQERFGSFTRVYYKDAVSAIVVFDLDRPKSLQTALKWKQDIDEKVTLPNGQPLPVVLVGNKSDLIREKDWARSLYTKQYFTSFCKDYGFVNWFTTSCLDGNNVDAPFQFIGDYVLKNQIYLPTSRKVETIRISNDYVQPVKKPCCST